MSSPRIALVAVTRRGVEQARRLRQRLRAGDLYRTDKHGPPAHAWEHVFSGPLADQVGELFAAHAQLVFFLAAGAVTRLIAPHLSSKSSDPGVLAVDEAGRFVVPVLSGHEGGANEFARTLAACLGAIPVITTASDVLGGFSLDRLAAEWGWTLEPAERIKPAALALVNGDAVAIVQELAAPGRRLDELELPGHVSCLRRFEDVDAANVAAIVGVSDRLRDQANVLWLRPRSLLVGVGCERGIALEALEDGLSRFLAQHGFARGSVAALATIDIKRDEQAIAGLAGKLGCGLIYFSAAELAGVAVPSPSAVVEKCVGTAGVAEAAALLAAHAERLLVDKQVMASPVAPQRMTFALARSSLFAPPVEAAGKVIFIGAGPGDPELLTLKGRRLLARADVVVYAGSLVPAGVLRHAAPTAALHNSASLTLEEIGRIMVDAARAGQQVARLQSGDTSIYSAIQEQMTLLEQEGIDYEVVPGVSSFQAAAALLQSELTLPEKVQTVILTRGEGQTKMPAGEELAGLARHQATLCIFLSARLAERVQEQLLTAYPPETPVAILHRVTWPDERIVRTQLDRLATAIAAEQFTRTTLILVGTALGARENRSRLYDQAHGHLFRPRRQRARSRILLLSGTSEGPLLARALLEAGFAVRATVTRPEAIATLFGNVAWASQGREPPEEIGVPPTDKRANSAKLIVEARGFTEEALAAFLAAGEADLVVDATHPFAVRITQIARRVCARLGVPLVRYERPDWAPPEGTLFVDSFQEAAARLPGLGRRTMLTIGAKQLKHFAHLHDRLTMFARVLPGEVSLAQARAAGFAPGQVIQERPPFTREENRALFEKLGVDVLLTKASGKAGGVAEKVLAACDLQMTVLMIRRPAVESTESVDSIAAAVAACLARSCW